MTEAISAHQQMMDAHNRGDGAGAQALSERVNIETGISPVAEGDASQVATHQLAPMPDAPKLEANEVSGAIATLTEIGGEHAELVQKWERQGANPAEELGYAKAAFKDIATNRPDLISKFDASGLGNDPAVLEFLAQHGRLQAGMMGDLTVAQRYSAPSETPAFRGNGSKASAQTRVNQLIKDNPPGTDKYKQAHVQREIAQLMSAIHGDGDIVGSGGRTA